MLRTAEDFAALYRAVREECGRARADCALARALRTTARQSVSDSAEQRIRLQHARAPLPAPLGFTD